MKIHGLIAGLLIAFLLALSLMGCGTSHAVEDPQVLAKRKKYILSDEPQGAVTVADAKEAVKKASQIVLVGRIGAGEHTPWDDGKASFLISDAAAIIDAHGHRHRGNGHDHENCPFCNRDKALNDSLAIVQFTDDNGDVLSIDARKLLGVEADQLVVVRGTGKVDGLGHLIVSADGIYVRR